MSGSISSGRQSEIQGAWLIVRWSYHFTQTIPPITDLMASMLSGFMVALGKSCSPAVSKLRFVLCVSLLIGCFLRLECGGDHQVMGLGLDSP
jgi:hypothetical protein